MSKEFMTIYNFIESMKAQLTDQQCIIAKGKLIESIKYLLSKKELLEKKELELLLKGIK